MPKITQLTELLEITSEDLFVVANEEDGQFSTQKIKSNNVMNYFKANIGLKESVKAATKQNYTANESSISQNKITIAIPTLSGTASLDGIEIEVGDRVLIKNQTLKRQNGIFSVESILPSANLVAVDLVRSYDAFSSENLENGSLVFVEEGENNSETFWFLSADQPIEVNVTELNFSQVSSGVPSTYIGQTSITTLGTVGTGVWQGTAVAVAYGGTGSTTGSITGTGVLAFTAGANSNINLIPNGTGTVNVNSKKITSLATPTQNSDAATKEYVDAIKQGLDVKDSVRVATVTAFLDIDSSDTSIYASDNVALPDVDGVSLNVGDRILVKNQLQFNGIYYVKEVGENDAFAWELERAKDADASSKVTLGMFTFVEEGTVNADSGWVLTNNGPITLGLTELTFSQFSGAGQVGAGAGMTKTGNTLDVVGTTNRITVNADSVDIANTYIGQTSITTLGTVGTGVWQGTAVAVAYGGTGSTTGSITGTGVLAFTAGANSNINLIPNGTGTVNVNSKKITSLATPTENTDAATKAYVDSVATGSSLGTISSQDSDDVSITGGSVNVTGSFNTGAILIGDSFSTGRITVRSPIIDFKIGDSYASILEVPSDYMLLLDRMEVITTEISNSSEPPTICFGTESSRELFYAFNHTTSNNFGSRHIIDNPQNGVESGARISFGISTPSTATLHNGFAMITGYLLKKT